MVWFAAAGIVVIPIPTAIPAARTATYEGRKRLFRAREVFMISPFSCSNSP